MLSIFFLFSCVVVNHSLAEYDPTTHSNWHLLQNPYCDGNTNSRIVGGVPAGSREFPWIAGLIAQSEQTGELIKYICSGSVLNKRTILTAAHCGASQEVEDENGRKWEETLVKVALGDHNKETDSGIPDDQVQIIDVDEIILHGLWVPDERKHDIALLRLAKDIQFNSHIGPICLPRGHLMTETFNNFRASVAGWGIKNRETEEYSEILLKVDLRVHENPRCKSKKVDLNWQLCVIPIKGGTGAFEGDSGGPLMIVDHSDGEPRVFIIGIVSYSLELRSKSSNTSLWRVEIHTRVTAYMPWILDNLAGDTGDFSQV